VPLIETSQYQPPILWRSGHLSTVYPALLRRPTAPPYRRTTLELDDGDFLDLDWLDPAGTPPPGAAGHLVITLHGLEGAADRAYVRQMLYYFVAQSDATTRWTGLGVNFRSCSGRINRLVRSYHMGATDDVDRVVAHALSLGYRSIVLVGFSLGGNVLLRYFGERADAVPAAVRVGVAFSVPCHIASATERIERWDNRLYVRRFLRSLNAKMYAKAARHPGQVPAGEPMPRNFRQFDDRFTGPIHGFGDALNYWESCSSLYVLERIRRPVLLVNARNDSFLSPRCFPVDLAAGHEQFYLETPDYGGHVGFVRQNSGGFYWSEERAYRFVRAHL
jgi:predicted alpha/beta-fold hydrolase